MELVPATWYSRIVGSVRGWFASPTKPPPVPGSTETGVTADRRLANNASAESDLEALSLSPTVFAAVTGQALSMATYPIKVYRGWSMGATRAEAIDPDESPATARWVGRMLRMLHRPDPEDRVMAMFPRPGEGLIAQIWADLQTSGNFYVRPTLDDQGWIVGLTRLHPASCSIEIRMGVLCVAYRSVGRTVEYYPYDEVSHGRLLSWEKSGQGLVGTGAGRSLAPIVAAERTALTQTAESIGQGGGQILITSMNDQGGAYLSDKKRREEVADEVASRLNRRVLAVGPNLKAEASGWKPADMLAPELMASAPTSELQALGVVPMVAGHDSGTYATAAQQYRVQATRDEGMAGVIEAYLLRPLAQHFARRAAVRDIDRITCRIDLSGHPGYTYLRTDALNRAKMWMQMGCSFRQAMENEGLDVEDAEKEPQGLGSGPQTDPNAPQDGLKTGQTPGPKPGQAKPVPRRPVGDQGDPLPNK